MDPAIITAPIHRLTRPHQGCTVHTQPVTLAKVVLAAVPIARDETAHAVVGVHEGIGAMDRRVDNGMLVGIKSDIVQRVVSDCMGH
jgi:hypothetical protein